MKVRVYLDDETLVGESSISAESSYKTGNWLMFKAELTEYVEQARRRERSALVEKRLTKIQDNV